MEAENRVDGAGGGPEKPANAEAAPAQADAPPDEQMGVLVRASEEAAREEPARESQGDVREAEDADDSGEEDADEEEEPPAALPLPPPAVESAPPEPEPRRHSHVAPAHLAIDRIDEDETFRIRPEGELSALATDLARLGQLFPVDVRLRPPDRFQIVCGFRRVSALRFLQRDRVLARLHTDLSDEDALLMALASVIHAQPASREELRALRDRLDSEGRLNVAARDMFEKALTVGDPLAPEGVEEEIDADELAQDVAQRLGSLNQDLSLLADVFVSLDESRKAELLMQLRYSAELVTYLENL